jgi:hypothetical protein
MKLNLKASVCLMMCAGVLSPVTCVEALDDKWIPELRARAEARKVKDVLYKKAGVEAVMQYHPSLNEAEANELVYSVLNTSSGYLAVTGYGPASRTGELWKVISTRVHNGDCLSSSDYLAIVRQVSLSHGGKLLRQSQIEDEMKKNNQQIVGLTAEKSKELQDACVKLRQSVNTMPYVFESQKQDYIGMLNIIENAIKEGEDSEKAFLYLQEMTKQLSDKDKKAIVLKKYIPAVTLTDNVCKGHSDTKKFFLYNHQIEELERLKNQFAADTTIKDFTVTPEQELCGIEVTGRAILVIHPISWFMPNQGFAGLGHKYTLSYSWTHKDNICTHTTAVTTTISAAHTVTFNLETILSQITDLQNMVQRYRQNEKQKAEKIRVEEKRLADEAETIRVTEVNRVAAEKKAKADQVKRAEEEGARKKAFLDQSRSDSQTLRPSYASDTRTH